MEENAVKESKMRKHVTVVGAIHIGFGIIGLVGAIGLFFLFTFLKGMVGDDDVAQIIMSFLSISLPILVGFMSTLGLVGGIGLLSFQPWARFLVIVVAALGCLNIPIGTLKGVYSLWVLLQDETIAMFQKN
jgi:hypothetical protein